MPLGLAVTTALTWTTAAAFATISMGLLRRKVDGALRRPHLAHAFGWSMLAVMAFADGMRVFFGLVGDPGHVGYLAFVYVKILATSAAFGGFGVFVAGIWTLSLLPARILTGLAGAHATYFVAATTARLPFDVVIGQWSTRLVLSGVDQVALVGLLLFFGPMVALLLAYALVVRHIDDVTRRYRVVTVAVAITMFQLTGIVQSNPDTPPDSMIVLWSAAMLAFTGLVAVLAYYPPAPVRRRLHIRSLTRGHQVTERRQPAQ